MIWHLLEMLLRHTVKAVRQTVAQADTEPVEH